MSSYTALHIETNPQVSRSISPSNGGLATTTIFTSPLDVRLLQTSPANHGKHSIKISWVANYHVSAFQLSSNVGRCKRCSNMRSDTYRYRHDESYTFFFCEFLELGTKSRSKRNQQNITIHYPKISVKPVKQCQDNKT